MHRLALAMGMPVAELARRMSASELADWIAYSRLEPFGPGRSDARAWAVIAAIARVTGGRGPGPEEILATEAEPFDLGQWLEARAGGADR